MIPRTGGATKISREGSRLSKPASIHNLVNTSYEIKNQMEDQIDELSDDIKQVDDKQIDNGFIELSLTLCKF